MEVSNWSEFIHKKPRINLNPFAPRWPFRLLMIGPTGSGKTNIMVDLVIKHLYYEKIYVVAKDLNEDFYIWLKSFFNATEELGGEVEAIFTDNLDDLPDVNDLDERDISKDDDEEHQYEGDLPQVLVVFDDFITVKNQSKISEFFIRGRKKNISIIYLTQKYFKTPEFIRSSCDYFTLSNITEKRDLRAIADTHSTRITYDEFMQYYKEITEEPFNFMVIDKHTPHMFLHVRKNWDGIRRGTASPPSALR